MTNDQIAEYCVPKDTEHISREAILNCVMDALTVKEDQNLACQCLLTGWITVKCCNICGLPLASEKWNQ